MCQSNWLVGTSKEDLWVGPLCWCGDVAMNDGFLLFNPNLGGGNFIPCWFSLNNSEFAAFSNISIETSVPNLISLTPPSPQSPVIEQNSGKNIFDFRISGQSLIKKTVITPEPVIILPWNMDQNLNVTRKTKQQQNFLIMTSSQEIVTSLSFFQFMANLEQSGRRIPMYSL